MARPKDLKNGVRVILAADLEEGIPEEMGICEGDWDPSTETVIVRIDDKYITEPGDDGLRETTCGPVQLE